MKRIIPLALIIFLLILIKNSISSIYKSTNNEGLKEKIEKQVIAEEKKQIYLNERLYYINTDEFIEEEAKERLGMLAPDEVFVIAPTESPISDEIFKVDVRPNWRKWLDLFF